MSQTKTCRKCSQSLPIHSFQDGKNTCRKCRYQRRLDLIAEDPEIFMREVYKIFRYRTAKRTKPIPFEIEPQDIIDMYYDQRGRCALSGRRLTHSRNGANRGVVNSDNISIDRVDSNLGYTKDNIQLTCARVNLMKGSLSDEQFVELCREIADHNE